ncbi:hypothetical protein EV421DRAFT_2042646 [Armillaria borealis]|uniref:Uncharacterized protein n=1 Tax=Armillaria borealis TaxID=47425 RepID=A0AA39ITU9_9AGAR|nr:hypothetical protein EV421DRAFT_2042646 [Armillaria borealis]
MSTIYNDFPAILSKYPNSSAGTDAPKVQSTFSFPSAYSNELAGLATPSRERLNATIPQFDPDSLLFAFPFSQPEDSFVSPVSTLLPTPPSYDEDTEFQEDNCGDDMTVAYAKVVQRKFIFPPVTMLATPPTTPQRQRNGKPGRTNRFEPYNLRDRSPEQNPLNTGSSPPSPLMSPSPSCRSQTRSDKPTSSSTAPQTNPRSVISAPSSTSVSSSTTGNKTLEAEPCPRHCVQEDFPPEFVHEVAQKFGLSPDQILHYRKMDGNFHYCPLDCGHYTVGTGMAHHLKKHHPDIEGTTVTCSVKSLKGERCLRQPMEGAKFLEHFERDHCIREALCPFCLTVTPTPKLMDHFAVCSEIAHPVEERKPRVRATSGGWVARTLRRKKLPLPRVQKAPSFVMKLRPKKRRLARYA